MGLMRWTLNDWPRSVLGKRRLFGPSWSWAGWAEEVKWTDFFDPEEPAQPAIVLSARFELELLGGRVIGWKEFLAHERITRQALVSHFVHITTCFTDVRVRKNGRGYTFLYPYAATPELADQDHSLSFDILFEPDCLTETVPEFCEAIHLALSTGCIDKSKYGLTPTLLFVGERHGRMERIGTQGWTLLSHYSVSLTQQRNRN